MAVPAHTALGVVAVMLTDGVVVGLIVMVNPLLVAVLVEIHEAFDVKTHVTAWPLVIDAVVKLEAVAPFTLAPLMRHW